MFTLVFLSNFTSIPVAIRILTQQKVTAFFLIIAQVSVLSLFNLGFVPFLLLKDLYKQCCCSFIVTPFHLRLGF